MDEKKLKELVLKLVQEYTGTGDMASTGATSDDGNNMNSPRPFADEEDELENYTNKNVYGAEGGHYRKDKYTGNYPNRHKMPMFELKKYIKDYLKEQAYGSATLTTQGPPRIGIRVPTDEYPFSAMPKRTSTGMFENKAQELADTYALHQLKQMRDDLMKDMEQEAEPEGGPIADYYGDQLNDIDQAIQIIQGVDDRFNKKYGPGGVPRSYDEVYLRDKLVGIKDAYEYEVIKGKGRITIYPDLGSLQRKSRSSQEIVFTKDRGEIAFVRAFGYERSYNELKKVLPELPEMGDSSFAGFMNVYDKPIPVDIDTALEMIKAMVRGRDAESKAQSDFYSSRGPTSGTIDEFKNVPAGVKMKLSDTKKKIKAFINNFLSGNLEEEEVHGKEIVISAEGLKKAIEFIGDRLKKLPNFALDKLFKLFDVKDLKTLVDVFPKNLKDLKPILKKMEPKEAKKFGIEINKLHVDLKRKNMKEDLSEQASEDKAYQRKLKSMQKAILQFQLNHITKKMNDARAQASKAMSQSSQGFEKQIQALKKQIQAIDKPPKKQQSENLAEEYFKERKNSDLMSFIDTYKRGVLIEGTMKKLFAKFEKGKTNEEVLRYYAKKGITMPEQFVSKARKQYENLKKQKLEIEFSEQEAKDIVSIPTKAPDVQLFDMPEEEPSLYEEEPKKLTKRLYK